MKVYDTTKLFWGEYQNKIVIVNKLAPIFRGKNLSHARTVLDELQRQYEKGEVLIITNHRRKDPIQENTFLDARKIYYWLDQFEDYLLRIEGSNLAIYSNNINDFKLIAQEIFIDEWYQPSDLTKVHLAKDTIIIPRDIGYEYKVTLGSKKGSPAFANWASKNPKQIKAGPVFLKSMQSSDYVNGMYFYARDQRTLDLCSLMLDNIRRIDRLIVKTSI